MFNKIYNEIHEAIENINNDLYEQTENDLLHLTYFTNSYIDIIKLAGFEIWNSEDDYREFNEDKNDYEELEPYLRKEINKLLRTLTKVKL